MKSCSPWANGALLGPSRRAPYVSVSGPHSAPSSGQTLNCASLGTARRSGWTGGCRLSAALLGGDWSDLEFHAGGAGAVCAWRRRDVLEAQRRAVIALAAASS